MASVVVSLDLPESQISKEVMHLIHLHLWKISLKITERRLCLACHCIRKSEEILRNHIEYWKRRWRLQAALKNKTGQEQEERKQGAGWWNIWAYILLYVSFSTIISCEEPMVGFGKSSWITNDTTGPGTSKAH